MTPNRNQMVTAYILSATVVLVAALGSLLYTETAAVKLEVPPQKLAAAATLTGSPTSNDLKTQQIQVTVTEVQVGTPTTVQVAATYATGQVVFSCPSPGCTGPVTVESGTLLTNSKALSYATQAAATVTPTRTATVMVKATAAGASWNSAKDSVTVINNSPNPGLKVTNPAAIAGGTDASSFHVIKQSDLDAARTALTAKVTDSIDTTLKAETFQMSYIANGKPTLSLTSDHKVGDMVSSFTMTMTGTMAVTAFSNSEAQTLIRAALDAKVPVGQQLTNDSIQITWSILRTGANGDVLVKGTALGYITPKLSNDTLRARLRGLSPSEARKSLERAVPGGKVDIRISPVAVPWLPLITDHITLTVLVQPATA